MQYQSDHPATGFSDNFPHQHCALSLRILPHQARSALKQAQTVYQAAQLAGYDNPECFSKAFKKQFGSNPSEYRMKAV
ncbi:helix-turn-helix domain-containing protein [Neisseria weixii]|uniref:helix-turn-helix domain-containing protein n=1 Tax=Neisseria weixii TaxID=1853276 RepID=UPI000BB8D897|nr:helix-turn-helix domain-containing protein [Neisseria weixii]ATD64794.1 hypothetical protein CGZ65_04820 [Neisseria weixii]